jgi:hypothetical protein
MSASAVMENGFEVSDVTGQKIMAVSDVPSEATVSEVVRSLIAQMRLPANDTEGRPLTYHARLDREGRHLLGSERVAEALQPGDRVVLQPNVDAGGAPCASAIAS